MLDAMIEERSTAMTEGMRLGMKEEIIDETSTMMTDVIDALTKMIIDVPLKVALRIGGAQ